jgi:hypothetical protein
MKRLTLLAIVVLSAACTINQPASSGGGTPLAPSGSGAGDAPGGDTKPGDTKPGGDTTPGGDTAPTKTGSITITQQAIGEMSLYTASASFADVTGAAPTPSGSKCTTVKDGDCTITECTTPKASGETPPPAGDVKKQPTAGEITVAGLEEITLSPDDKGMYTAKNGQVALFEGGAEVKFTAKGGEVPAFDKALTAPSVVSLTAPEIPAFGTGKLDLDRTADLDLTWDNGTVGDVQAMISSTVGEKTSLVMCTFKAQAGQGKISKAALGKLLVSDAGFVSLSAMSTTSFDQGGWKLSINALVPAASGQANIH